MSIIKIFQMVLPMLVPRIGSYSSPIYHFVDDLKGMFVDEAWVDEKLVNKSCFMNFD